MIDSESDEEEENDDLDAILKAQKRPDAIGRKGITFNHFKKVKV